MCFMNRNNASQLIILSGPVQTGKSAALMNWINGKSVCGFITPTISGKKMMFDISIGETSPFELTTSEINSIPIGKYHLAKSAFDKAKKILTQSMASPKNWIVIDEVGKLELINEGHHSLITELLASWEYNILLVVRTSILTEVILKYGLKNPVIIEKESLKDFC